MSAWTEDTEYLVLLCANCQHPGGQHITGTGCRLCLTCPEFEDGEQGYWTDRMTLRYERKDSP